MVVYARGYDCCICEEYYSSFKEMFGWKELDGWDIEWTRYDEDDGGGK